MGKQENSIQKACLDYLTLKNIFHWRNNSGAFSRGDHFYHFGAKGSPDIICCIDGQLIAIECKTPTGKQSENQKEFQRGLEKAGGKYWLIRDISELIIKL